MSLSTVVEENNDIVLERNATREHWENIKEIRKHVCQMKKQYEKTLVPDYKGHVTRESALNDYVTSLLQWGDIDSLKDVVADAKTAYVREVETDPESALAHYVDKLAELSYKEHRRAYFAKRKANRIFYDLLDKASAQAPDVHLTEYTKGFDGLTSLGKFEPGSDEWLTARAGDNDVVAIGGSDVAQLARAKKSVPVDLVRSKVNPTKVEYSETEAYINFGNAFEPVILERSKELLREYGVADVQVTKDSYVLDNCPEFHLNVDGVAVDDNGDAIGIIEVKTGWNEEDWGTAHVPPYYYVAQLLYYLELTGFDRGWVVFSVENGDPEVYEVYKGSTVDTPLGAVTVANIIDNWNPELYKQAMLGRKIGGVVSAHVLHGAPTPVDEITQMLADHERAYIVDLETTGLSELDDIIEVGIVDAHTGDVVYSELFKPEEDAFDAVGTGAQDIHHIVPEDVQDKDTFVSCKQEVIDILDGALVFAHNDMFERRFLENLLPHSTWVDTMKYASGNCPGILNAKLETWANYEGVEYPEDSHRAYVDCITTKKCIDGMISRLNTASL